MNVWCRILNDRFYWVIQNVINSGKQNLEMLEMDISILYVSHCLSFVSYSWQNCWLLFCDMSFLSSTISKFLRGHMVDKPKHKTIVLTDPTSLGWNLMAWLVFNVQSINHLEMCDNEQSNKQLENKVWCQLAMVKSVINCR